MGNAPSHGSEDEAGAAGGEGWGPHQDWAADASAIPGSGPAAPALPPAAALLEPARLREAAAALRPAPPCESLVSRHHGALLRWLEERLGRGEEAVTLEQFRELLEARGAGCSGEQFEEAFAQFDAEGDGTVDAENMLETLKNSSGANLQGELSHIIRQLQACSLVPGFIDIFSESKEGLGVHASLILRFLHRNRLSGMAIPCPMLDLCSNMCSMRASVLKESLDQLVQREKESQSPGDLTRSPEMDKLKSVAKCYAYIETSSNPADIDKMTNGETSSYWQSDGSARSHWIRLKMKPDVVLRHLSIAVAATDQSYMPQQVTGAVGRSASDLQDVRDVHIPSNVTGYVTLLENANISQLYVQINIKRCLGDGCDTRIHGLRAVGFQRVKKSGVSVSDASAIWYWSLLTSLVTASMETNPAFMQTVLHNMQKALQHMPPLSLSPGSTDVSTFLSPNVLEEVDSFLIRITSCCSTPEVELTLLAFALARGSVAKVLSCLCTIADHLDTRYDASSLISSMASVRQTLLLKYGKPLQLTLQACDVKGKEEKSGPEYLLVEPWTRDVRRGGIGAQCGLVFAYNSSSEKFHAEERFKRFEKYDKWKLQEFRQFVKSRVGCSADDLGEDDPIGWFELEEEWDEADVKLQQCRVAKYLMVKFLCTRQESAERLGVQGLSISGYVRPMRVEAEQHIVCAHCRKDGEESVCGTTLLLRTLQFTQQLAHDLVVFPHPREECICAQTLLLQLLQSCLSVLQRDGPATPEEANAPRQSPGGAGAAKELHAHLCDVVDRVDGDSVPMETLKQEVRNTLLSGAAVFFPDRQSRRSHLFTMMKNVTEQEHKQSQQLTFQSLCTYFSDKDPGGLLLLPEKGDLADMNSSEVLAVMSTLLSIASRECELLLLTRVQGRPGSVLFSLFWAVQGSLLSWCYLQLKSTDAGARGLAAHLIDQYVGQFVASTRVILESLLSQYSGQTIVEKLCNSVFSMAAPQLVIFLLDFCTLDISHCALLREFSTLTELLKQLCADPTGAPDKKLRQETRHADKRIKMLKRWDHYLPSEKLRCRVYKGVPPQVPGQVWLRLLNVHRVMARNAGKYQEMKEAALVSSRDIMQIDLDVNRTFRSHTTFWDRDGVGQRALFHMLVAYSVYDTEVGYCQGMSEIAAILLMFLPEEDAFWALAQLRVGDRHAMHGFFVPGFPKLLRFQAHHERVLQRALPDLSRHMAEEQMSPGIYTPRWFMQCFLGRTPFSLTLKLWDAYVLDGERVLTAMAYTTLKVHRKRLLKLPLEGLREFLQDSLAQPWALEDEAVLRHLRASMSQLRRMWCDLHPPRGTGGVPHEAPGPGASVPGARTSPPSSGL